MKLLWKGRVTGARLARNNGGGAVRSLFRSVQFGDFAGGHQQRTSAVVLGIVAGADLLHIAQFAVGMERAL